MPTFVDFAGMNTLVSSSFDDTNTITSEKNGEYTAESIPDHQELVGINLHRNGPYGYSTWKQLRVSENPISRHHRETNKMTFVIQPGPLRNVLPQGELRVRDRYSALYSYTEPAVCQKSYPLVWNVGRHFKDEDGNLAKDPNKFSIISSYGNSQIGFANEGVDELLGFDPNEEATEYSAIKSMYLENGLNKQDSPLTYWEFLQYRETVFPRAENQYIDKVRNRPQFESFYRHNREDRTKFYETSSFGYYGAPTGDLSQSSWPLEEHEEFLTRSYSDIERSIRWGQATENPNNAARISSYNRAGEGVLMSTLTQFWASLPSEGSRLNGDYTQMTQARAAIDVKLSPSPLYARRISLDTSQSVSNPSGMEIYGTSSTETLFQGGALWEAGANRYIKNDSGEYVHSPRYPFYDTYENYMEEIRKRAKNFAVIPEFRMSSQIEDFQRTDNAIELDMFELTGGISGSSNSSTQKFYEIYSNSDFMKQFELIDSDHEEFTNGKVLSLRCKAVKKLLPYEGFYPAQRTVDLAKRFYDSFGDNISVVNASGVQLSDFNYGKQMVMTPLFAPGVLFNTIKSGVAVDYPIITGSLGATASIGGNYFINQDFDKRIPFEALVSPQEHLKNYKLTSNEPHPSGNLSASATWDGDGDNFYSLMSNNFLAEIPEFFLPNGQLTSVVSKKQKDLRNLEVGKVYGMRVKMRRSMNKGRLMVYHSGSESNPYLPPQDIIKPRATGSFETFTMYSRPSAFGPPTYGSTGLLHDTPVSTVDRVFRFDEDRFVSYEDTNEEEAWVKDSYTGFNFPFTPPYYHGEGWCEMWFTASSETMTIQQIQNAITASYTRYDSSFYLSSFTGSHSGITFESSYSEGPQTLKDNRINKNAVQLSASLNLFGVGKVQARSKAGAAGSFVVDTAVDEDSRWIIQTKFETPMLNFSHVSGSDHLTLPVYGSGSVPRGIWHQHGRIPEENEGVFIEVGPIPENYQSQVLGRTDAMLDLSEYLGFSGVGTKLGRLASSKVISEAVVAVPFVEDEGRKKFFKLDKEKVQKYKDGDIESLTTGEAQQQIGRSVLNQMDKMKKFIFPPSFDFLNFDSVEPIAMYIFEFSHRLSQQDLSDIWQNLPPDIASEMEESEVAITHPLLKKELLGPGGEGGNKTIGIPNKLKWMVFKVKQRAASNYFKKTVLRNPEVNTDVDSGNVTQDEFGPTSAIQYNWPYDFFSLVEMVKIDAEVEFGNFDQNELNNYIDNIPSWSAVEADPEKIEFIVGGLEDDPIVATAAVEETRESNVDAQPSSFAANMSTNFMTIEQEGVFQSPGGIQSSESNQYVQFKVNFGVVTQENPSASFDNLFDLTKTRMEQLNNFTFESFSTGAQSRLRRWTNYWLNNSQVAANVAAEEEERLANLDAIAKKQKIATAIRDYNYRYNTSYNDSVNSESFCIDQCAKERAVNGMIATGATSELVELGLATKSSDGSFSFNPSAPFPSDLASQQGVTLT